MLTVRPSGHFITLTFIWFFYFADAHAKPSPVHVIVNENVNVTSMDKSRINWIFSMRQTSWEDGSAIKVYVLDSQNPIHLKFCKNVLGMFPYQIERKWNKLAYSGLGERPIVVSDSQEMLRMVSEQPGAIGYSMSSQLPSTVRAIQINREG